MAKIVNVEKPRYIDNIIGIYAKNKIGQYSKFLEKNPVYVTYYKVIQSMSGADVGTGNINSEIGSNSPIRFAKINNLPIYNLPTLKPDVSYDETGYDINLDCSDLTILPNTIKPKSGDYFLIVLPGTKEYLFRVNNFAYNTVQSNDFYLFDADIKRIGNNIEETEIKSQIVEEYETIFENIGTDDRCFLKSTDIDYINSLADLFHKLKDIHMISYYDNNVNAFYYNTGRYNECLEMIMRYDPYIERFIMRSQIYHEKSNEKTLALTPATILDRKFDINYNYTLYNAVLTRSVELLKTYSYTYSRPIDKWESPLLMYGIPTETIDIFCMDTPLIVNPDVQPIAINHPIVFCPEMIPVGVLSEDYFPHEFLQGIVDNTLDTDDYMEMIIFNYINRRSFTIDRKEVIRYLTTLGKNSFYYLPIILYILNQLYDEYFTKSADFDLIA